MQITEEYVLSYDTDFDSEGFPVSTTDGDVDVTTFTYTY